MNQIVMEPIGVVHSPYKTSKNMPIQGVFKSDIEASVQLRKEYVPGLKDLEGFSHAILVYHFHRSKSWHLEGRPFLERKTHGIFSIRSPRRPNHIGISVVKIKKIQNDRLCFTEVDILDGTPLLDIKPYVKYFDARKESVSGWLEKYFENGSIPSQTILK